MGGGVGTRALPPLLRGRLFHGAGGEYDRGVFDGVVLEERCFLRNLRRAAHLGIGDGRDAAARAGRASFRA